MKKIELDPEMLRRMHWDEGIPLYKLARCLGVGQMRMYRAFKRFDIPTRNQSEAMKLSIAKSGQDGKTRTTAAVNATRGKSRPEEYVIKAALSRQKNGKLSSIEKVFAEVFADLNLQPIPQYVVHRYNIYFAFPEKKIAVELDPDWHKREHKVKHNEKRDAYLASLGWTVIHWKRLTAARGDLRAKAKDLIQSLVESEVWSR